MSPVRQGAPGATRTCPHCRQTILESASVCPACKHHLRIDPSRKTSEPERPNFTPLRVSGVIEHPPSGMPWEYSVMLTVTDERGEVVTRHVASVGAIRPAEQRTFALSVEVFTTTAVPAAGNGAQAPAQRASPPGVGKT